MAGWNKFYVDQGHRLAVSHPTYYDSILLPIRDKTVTALHKIVL